MRKRGLKAILVGLAAAFLLTGCGGGTKPAVPPKPAPPEEKFDATKLPYYVEDTENLQYSYTDEERILPFWQGNVMRNEQLMITFKDGKTEGHLLYEAEKVLSVRDWSLQTEYEAGTDYVIEGNKITLPEGSRIPVFRDEWSRGENVPADWPEGNAGEGYQMIGDMLYTETNLIWGNYIHVSYVYDPAKVDRTVVKTYSGELFGLDNMLAAKRDIKMVVFGDSISEGHSSSGLWGHAPNQPQYAELVRQGIEKLGGVNVTLTNISKGGMTSKWGAEDTQLARLQTLAPDLLIIGFGTNDDTSDDRAQQKYEENIRTIIEAARVANADCQIVLVSPFPSREGSKSGAAHQRISDTLSGIVASEDYLDVMAVDMFKFCKPMLQVKNYYEIAGNNINHPNDFIHRCYAMNILSGLFDLSK